MTENIDLKELEKKIFKMTYEDGVFELVFGSMFFGMAFAPFFRETLPEPWRYFLWPLIIMVIVLSLFKFVKKYITAPRMGIVKLRAKKKSIKRRFLIFSIINTTILVIALILTISGIFTEFQIESALVGLILGLFFVTIPLSVIGYIIQYSRIYVIALMGGLGVFLAELYIPYVGILIGYILSYGVIGIIAILMGIVDLIKFLKKYPLPKESPKEEVSNG